MRRGVAMALVAAAAGCDPIAGQDSLHPEGPPEILQVFAIDGDGVSKLAFGTHPDIVDDDATDNVTPPFADQAGPVEHALRDGNRIRIIFDELLDSGTVEQFACACQPPTCATLGHAFPNGQVVDPTQCTSCQDNPGTPENETGQCGDANFDGVPDDAFLLPDVAVLDCGGVSVSIGPDDGFYNPSGNQLIPVLGGTDALGPALVLTPPWLPSDAQCIVDVAATVTDEDGNPIPAVAPTFHTDTLHVVATDPADGATGVALDATITVFFDAAVEPGAAGGTHVTATPAGGAPGAVAGTFAVDADDSTALVFAPDQPLPPLATIAVEVTPASFSFSFTTGAS